MNYTFFYRFLLPDRDAEIVIAFSELTFIFYIDQYYDNQT